MVEPRDFGLGAGRTLPNALAGAIVSVVVAFVPFSTVLGGVLAGYLQEGSTRDGVVAGGLSGLIALIPVLLVFGAIASFLSIGVFGASGSLGIAAGLWIVLALLAVFTLVYTVVLGAVGGAIGIYLVDDRRRGSRGVGSDDHYRP